MKSITAAELDAAFAAAMISAGPGPMNERELVEEILAECERLKLRVSRTPRSDRAGIRAGGRGWPDLVIASERGIIFRECKSDVGETSADQDMWIWLLDTNGLNIAIWQPSDWDSGKIQAELALLAA